MYNLHCHSLLSDGVLLPSEIACRFASCGYKVIAITDHADYSNIKTVVKGILEFSRHWPRDAAIKVLPGIELTHLPLDQFRLLAKFARAEGIRVVIGHGESPVEPVVKGTNRACLEAGVDILAHPGLITEEDAEFAKKQGIFLEVTARKGHCDTNRHVIDQARKAGAKLILDLDSHAPEDILTLEQLRSFALEAGLTEAELLRVNADVEDFLKHKGGR